MNKILFCYSCQCDTLHTQEGDKFTCVECHTSRKLCNPSASVDWHLAYALVAGAIAVSLVVAAWLT